MAPKEAPVLCGGATLPDPIYRIAILDFEDDFMSHHPGRNPNILYNQDPPNKQNIPGKIVDLGSLKGIEAFRKHKLECAGTDWPIQPIEGAIQIPSVLGAVVIIYNVPELTALSPPLNFTADTLAKIFSGKITKWDDPNIQRDNPGAPLLSKDIMPVVREDGSGTTHIFTSFLTSLSSSWEGGNDFIVKKWARASTPVKSNGEVAETVDKLDYSIGYVEYRYANTYKLAQANVQNLIGQKSDAIHGTDARQDDRARHFIAASVGAIRAAVPEDVSVPLASPEQIQEEFPNSTNNNDYPISGFTWLLAWKPSNQSEAVLCDFLDFLPGWMQSYAQKHQYASLPDEVDEKNRAALDTICPPTATLQASAQSGSVGSTVVITWTGLTGATPLDPKAVRLLFGGVRATAFSVDSDTQITATVPPDALTGKIRLKTSNGSAVSANDFTISK